MKQYFQFSLAFITLAVLRVVRFPLGVYVLVGALAALGLLLIWPWRHRWQPLTRLIMLYGILFLGIYWLAAALAAQPDYAYQSALTLTFYGVAFAWPLALARRGIASGTILEGLLAGSVVYWLSALYLWTVEGFPLAHYRFPVMTNTFGALAGMCLLLWLLRTLTVGHWRRELWYGLMAGAVLYLSNSRGAWLGLGVGLVVVVSSWTPLAQIVRAQARGLAAVSIPALVLVLWNFDLAHRGGRFGEWAIAFYAASLSPWWGLGPGSMYQFAPLPQPYWHVHSTPLNALAETGLVGLAAMMWTWCMVARGLLQAPRQLITVGALATFAALSAHSLVDAIAQQFDVTCTLALILGCAFAESENVYDRQSNQA